MDAVGSAIAQFWSWLASISAAFALAIFAGVQLFVVVLRWTADRRAFRNQTVGPAWLARRSLEENARNLIDYGFKHEVDRWETGKNWIDRVEAHMREVLKLSADAGGRSKNKGRQAFADWIGYADAMNAHTQGKLTYSEQEVVRRLFATIAALEKIQRRDASEPDVPTLEEMEGRLRQDGFALEDDSDEAPPAPEPDDDAESNSRHEPRLEQVYRGLLLPAILGTWFVWLVGGFSNWLSPQWFLGLWFALYYTLIFYRNDTEDEVYRPWHFLADLLEIILLYTVAIYLGAPGGAFGGEMTIPVLAVVGIPILGVLTAPKKRPFKIKLLRGLALGVAGIAGFAPIVMSWEPPRYYWPLVDLGLYVLLFSYAWISWGERHSSM